MINEQQTRLIAHIKRELSRDLTQALTDLAAGDGALTLWQLRQSARNFTGTELEKELAIHRYIQHWMPEVNTLLRALSLSQKNQQHLAERVDYYGAKLKRQSGGH
jgi:hypothetical protein